MTNNTCEMCAFWRTKQELKHHGECRRFPPKQTLEWEVQYPVMQNITPGCGEYECGRDGIGNRRSLSCNGCKSCERSSRKAQEELEGDSSWAGRMYRRE